MNKKQKAMLARIIVAFIIYILAIISEKSGVLENFSGIWPKLIVFLVPYLIIGWDIIYKAGRGIINGQVFDENFLMTIATFGAFGVKEYSEASFIRWVSCSRITRLTAPDSLSAI